MAAGGSIKVILGSLAANLGIALAKGVAAAMTGSGAMLAEAIHSGADCLNQVLLLIGTKQAQASPSAEHPLGHGRAAYFWSFLVALMIFMGGGVISIREGIHKVQHPEPLENIWVAVGVLVVSLLLEFGAMTQAVRALNEKRGATPFFAYLRETTDADLIVLFAEDSAAVIGLFFALCAIALSAATGDGRWDGYGSIVIGVLLTLVAVWLAREVKSLLEGERANVNIENAVREEVAKDPRFLRVTRVLTIQQGPGQVLVAAKISPVETLSARALIDAINELERRVEQRHPEVIWQFIEPDDAD